jgi:hypothetical protein
MGGSKGDNDHQNCLNGSHAVDKQELLQYHEKYCTLSNLSVEDVNPFTLSNLGLPLAVLAVEEFLQKVGSVAVHAANKQNNLSVLPAGSFFTGALAPFLLYFWASEVTSISTK